MRSQTRMFGLLVGLEAALRVELLITDHTLIVVMAGMRLFLMLLEVTFSKNNKNTRYNVMDQGPYSQKGSRSS